MRSGASVLSPAAFFLVCAPSAPCPEAEWRGGHTESLRSLGLSLGPVARCPHSIPGGVFSALAGVCLVFTGGSLFCP